MIALLIPADAAQPARLIDVENDAAALSAAIGAEYFEHDFDAAEVSHA